MLMINGCIISVLLFVVHFLSLDMRDQYFMFLIFNLLFYVLNIDEIFIFCYKCYWRDAHCLDHN
jgi:hypothetical protein